MDEDAKKNALRMIPYGLYVVGVRSKEVKDPASDLNAFIASWVTQVSFKPPMVALAVRRKSRSREMIRDSGVFTLNLLGEGQKAMAETFFKDLQIDEKKMSGVGYRVGQTGAPVFPGLPAYLECQVEAFHEDGGDHDVVVGRVVGAGYRPEADGMLTHHDAGWHYGG
jgi:flavin reductase (DIM6/NTAB) family NADH-FMN oxidoreductase RutF